MEQAGWREVLLPGITSDGVLTRRLIVSDMMISTDTTNRPSATQPCAAEAFVERAAAMLRDSGSRHLSTFDQFPAPLYATDANGTISYFNSACIEFAGRTPAIGIDRWCVSWKLHGSNGAALPHDQCPMAIAVRDGRPVRGVEAFAERPDGERRGFRPFPTPAIDGAGTLVGAVNLLVPTDGHRHRDLLATATKCRNLAYWVSDRQASDTLKHMADECEQQAAVLAIR